MAKKENDKKDEVTAKYDEYFADDFRRLEAELDKSEDLYQLIYSNIEKLNKTEARNAYHYLLENFKNIIALQTQKQGLLKDQVALKKIIMDYSLKDQGEDADKNSLLNELSRMIDAEKKKAAEEAKANPYPQPMNVDDIDLDSEIDHLLDEDDDK